MDAFWERDRYTRQLPNHVLRRWSIGAVHRVGPPWQARAWLSVVVAASIMTAAAMTDRHEVSGHHDDGIFGHVAQVGDVALQV